MFIINKNLVLILFLVFSSPSFAFKVNLNEVLLLGSNIGQQQKIYAVSKNNILNVLDWNGEGTPPLAQVKELAISRHEEKFGYINTKFKSIDLRSKQTNFNKNLKCPDKLWHYKVKIRGELRVTCIILLKVLFLIIKQSKI